MNAITPRRIIYTETDSREVAKRRHAENLALARKRFAEGRREHGLYLLALAATNRRDFKLACQQWRTHDMRLLDGKRFIDSGGFDVGEAGVSEQTERRAA